MAVLGLGNYRPSEVNEPPPSIAGPGPDNPWGIGGVLQSPPPLYVYTQRREPDPSGGQISYVMAPSDNSEQFYDLHIGWHEAPDPIRQSDFYAHGNKIHPEAQMQIVSNIAIGDKEAIDYQTFMVGKLLGYWKRPMFQGKQLPSRIRSNIEEAQPTTYGSLQQVSGTPLTFGPSTAAGFALPTSSSIDGYPY